MTPSKPRNSNAKKLYWSLTGKKPEERYHAVFPDADFQRDREYFGLGAHIGWTPHPDALRLAFSDLPRILENWDRKKVFVAWCIGLGNPPQEHLILASKLKQAGVQHKIYAVDINPEITSQIKRTKEDGSEIIPVNADILFAHPPEKSDLVSLCTVAQYVPRELQGKLASFLHSSLNKGGVLITDAVPGKREANYSPSSRSMNYEFFQQIKKIFKPLLYSKKSSPWLQPQPFSSMWRKVNGRTADNRRV